MGLSLSSSELRGIFAVAILAAVWAALVLGILAIASGNALKRLLQTHSSDTALNSKARSAVVLGWSALAVVALFWIIHFLSKRRMLL